MPIIVSNVYLRKTSFHNDISSHFKFLLYTERLYFCVFFKINDQKGLNAEYRITPGWHGVDERMQINAERRNFELSKTKSESGN